MNDLSTSRRLGELMRRTTPPHPRQEHLEGRARLVASVDRMRGSRRRRAVAAIAVAAVAAGVALVLLHDRPRALAWHVEDGTVEARGYVSVPRAALSARLVFDDGSVVSLAPGSRGRVGATSSLGAEVVLEEGRAEIHVQHHTRTAWTIEAGPYAIHVTGTDFLAAWAADAEKLDVWMRSGRVVVSGPVPGDDVALSTGEHLTAKVDDRGFRIDGSSEPFAAPSSSAPEVVQGARDGVERSLASASDASGIVPSEAAATPLAPGPRDAAPSWSNRVAVGEYARVVREAESEGLGRAIAGRPLMDLRSLGDAARYTGRTDLAERVYRKLRERFPSSPEARTAAFLLGRIAEEQEHATGEAVRWYDVYVAEAPAGGFAADALGRKMILVSRLQGRDAARPLAERYLERFPNGTYSAAAHDLAP
jgi:hypothetical protein